LPENINIPDKITQRRFEIMRWVFEPRYNVNFRQSKQDVVEIYDVTLQWLKDILESIEKK